MESLEEVTTSLEVGWTDVCVSSSSWPLSWCKSCPVWVSQTQAKRSHPAVTTWSPPGSQSAAMTTPMCPARDLSGVRSTEQPYSLLSETKESARAKQPDSPSTSSSSEEATRPEKLSLLMWTAHCQMWAVPSPLAVNTSSLSGWNLKWRTSMEWLAFLFSFLSDGLFYLTELTDPLWPVYWSSGFPECIPHTMAVWSAEAVPRMGMFNFDTDTSHTPSLCPAYLLDGRQWIVGGPFRLDMIFVVCWRSLLVCDLYEEGTKCEVWNGVKTQTYCYTFTWFCEHKFPWTYFWEDWKPSSS